VAALVVVILAAAAFVLSSRSSGRTRPSSQSRPTPAQTPQLTPAQTPQSPQPKTNHPEPPAKPPAVPAPSLAASWVATQIGHDASVACDKAMCHALTARGFPGRHLRLIRPGSSAPPNAQVVVVTPAVQRQFGGSRTTKWAPAVLARFGTGTAGISVRIAAPHGAAKYQAALKADLRSRKARGASLLTKPHISASAAARKQLQTGQVDSRLIVVLTALASVHPIRILDFVMASPGASAGMPLRIANLAQDYAASGMRGPAYIRFLSKALNLEPGIYKPEAAGPAYDASGTPIFRIKFLAPSPLGVLGSPGP
jgi:hypothetical protein